jgi:hypothetical protein
LYQNYLFLPRTIYFKKQQFKLSLLFLQYYSLTILQGKVYFYNINLLGNKFLNNLNISI